MHLRPLGSVEFLWNIDQYQTWRKGTLLPQPVRKQQLLHTGILGQKGGRRLA